MTRSSHSKDESEGRTWAYCFLLSGQRLTVGIWSCAKENTKHDLLRLSGSFCPDKAGGSICCLTTMAGPAYWILLKSQPVWGGCVYLNGSSYVIPGKDNTGKKCRSHLFFPWLSLVAGLFWKGDTWQVPLITPAVCCCRCQLLSTRLHLLL